MKKKAKKNPVGRPHLKPEQRKSNKVYTFLTDRDLERLDAECEKEDLNRSKLIARIIQRSLIRRRSL